MKMNLAVLIIVYCIASENESLEVPGMTYESYSKPGDVTLGFLTSIRPRGLGDNLCGNGLLWAASVQEVEAFVYAIDRVNMRSDLLPNITIGFAIMDDCNNDLAALARSYFFLHVDNGLNKGDYEYCHNEFKYFNVKGVVGPYGSRRAILSASLFSIFHIPIISTYATSDQLSDKSRYKYFLRLVSPDKIQVQAMMDFISYHNWTYISMVYSEGTYGENGANLVEKQVTNNAKLCMAISMKIYTDATDKHLDDIIVQLLKYHNARVVVLFAEDFHATSLFNKIAQKGLRGQFMWLCSDSMAYGEYGHGADGAFVMHHIDGASPQFDQHYLNLTVTNTSSIWMRELWQHHYGCIWNMSAANQSCYLYADLPHTNQVIESYVYKVLDAVDTFAIGLHNLIEDLCPEAFTNQSIIDACVVGKQYLYYLRNVTFTGISGQIEFDSMGDVKGWFAIKQYLSNQSGRGDIVAVWDKRIDYDRLAVLDDSIDWTVYPGAPTDVSTGLPESVCSKPCNHGYYFVLHEQVCCWECHACRDNERVFDNRTGCEVCPETFWPDEQVDTLCSPTTPSYLQWSNQIVVGMLVLVGMCVCCSCTVIAFLFKNRNNRLIKASSKPMSALIICGIIMAYLTVVFILSKPSAVICILGRVGFDISVTLVYAPLLVKTIRVYRIFAAGRRGIKKPHFIGSKVQMVATITLIGIQVSSHISLPQTTPLTNAHHSFHGSHGTLSILH